MSNPYYNNSGSPVTGSTGSSAVVRTEFASIAAGFALLPALLAGTAVVVNGDGTALTNTVGTLALAGNLATTGAFSTTFAQQANVTLTLPESDDTLVGRATADTLTNKSISGSSNTLTNIANASLTNSDVTIGSTSVSLGGTATTVAGLTLTAPTISTITNTGTITLPTSTDTLVGRATTDTLTNKTLTSPVLNGTITGTGVVPAAQGGAGTISGLLKADGSGTVSEAVSGTDYAPATSGTAILYGDGSGGFSGVTIGTNLTFSGGTLSAASDSVTSVAGRTGAVTLSNSDISGLGSLATQDGTFSGTSSGTNTGDQTITLTGDVTGSGNGSFAATVAKIAGVSVGTPTGTGNVVMSASPTLSGTIGGNLTFSGALTFPGSTVIDSSGNIGIGATPTEALTVGGLLTGGIGAVETGGTLDWNDVTNARSGNGHSLLEGTYSNGPSGAGANYLHSFSFEYATKDGSGDLTQFAIPYSNAASIGLYLRGRTANTWSSWYKVYSGFDASGSIAPDTDNSANLGTSGHRWSQLYAVEGVFSSTVSMGALTVTGAITATGNITAYYSDDRLKTRLGDIENALEKVMSLKGFYYEANDTAVALGYERKRDVALSAQDVQAIMPEVVAPAPIDHNYLTLRYERLVPLLVEAIKEQQDQIEALRAELLG